MKNKSSYISVQYMSYQIKTLNFMITQKSKSVIGLPLSEHVPDLTAKDDIIIIKILYHTL